MVNVLARVVGDRDDDLSANPTAMVGDIEGDDIDPDAASLSTHIRSEASALCAAALLDRGSLEDGPERCKLLSVLGGCKRRYRLNTRSYEDGMGSFRGYICVLINNALPSRDRLFPAFDDSPHKHYGTGLKHAQRLAHKLVYLLGYDARDRMPAFLRAYLDV